jgi:hypothetical protein
MKDPGASKLLIPFPEVTGGAAGVMPGGWRPFQWPPVNPQIVSKYFRVTKDSSEGGPWSSCLIIQHEVRVAPPMRLGKGPALIKLPNAKDLKR